MLRRTEPAPRSNAPWWFAVGFVLLVFSALMLWSQLGSDGDWSEVKSTAQASQGPTDQNPEDLVALVENERQVQATNSNAPDVVDPDSRTQDLVSENEAVRPPRGSDWPGLGSGFCICALRRARRRCSAAEIA